MSYTLSWVAFPALLAALSLGAGVAVARLSGARIPGTLLMPLGLAAIVVVGQFFVAFSSLAHLATPAVTLLGVAGLGALLLDRPSRARGDAGAVAAAVGVFLVFAAPAALSGEATFLGYIKLDDTATWLNIVDHVMSHGRDLSGLPPSSYEANLAFYLGTTGYPVGAFVPWGAVRPLVGQDAAWLFQPYIAFLAAMVALVLHDLARGLVSNPWLRAVVAFVAAQSALVIGFAWWGGVKELATTWLVALIAALVPVLLRSEGRPRVAIAFAVPLGAAVSVLGLGAGPWLAPLLLAAGIAAWRMRGRGWALRQALAVGVAGAVLAAPALPPSSEFLSGGGPLYTGGGLFNLHRPLSWLQLFGIWPSSDFRDDPVSSPATYLLIAVAAVAAAVALRAAWRRRDGAPVLYLAATLIGAAAIDTFSAPWIVAKALVTTSPAVLLLAMAGAATLIGGRTRWVGALALGAITAGVLWSNVLGYGDVSLAPADRFADLAGISHLVAGQGPTLVTEPEIYADRHFLRAGDPEGAGDYRVRPIALRDGRKLDKQAFADTDSFAYESLLPYRTIVMRRSPATSRPPSTYQLAGLSRFYEVWRRPADARSEVLEHMPLGDQGARPYCGAALNGPFLSLCPVEPVGVPTCSRVRDMAGRAAREGATLVAATRTPTLVVEPARMTIPAGWPPDPNTRGAVPTSAGAVTARIDVPRTGTFTAWLGGAFQRPLRVTVDGEPLATAPTLLNNPGQYVSLGTLGLGPGAHTVTITDNGPYLRPGSAGELGSLGPFALTQETGTDAQLVSVKPAEAGRLCGRTLDWIESVRPL